MNNLLKLLLILIFSLTLYAKEDFVNRFGFLSEGTILSSFKDARVALKVWLEDTAHDNDTKVEIEFHKTSNSLYKALKNRELDMVVLDLPFFIKNQKDIFKTSDNFWSLNIVDDKFTQYYLIAKKSLNAKGFKDIKNKTVSLKKGTLGSFVWADKNSYIINKSSLKKVTKEIQEKKKESFAVLNVFFNKSDFAVIRKKTWDIMTELNPSISNKLEVIKKSQKNHIPFIGIFHKNTNKKVIDIFFKLSKELKNVDGIEKMVELLKVNSIFKIDNEFLKVLDKYYSEYFSLIKKYK
ncbi:hypothetical protein LPB137_03145 [Poseidonibacter parvus]|uniref:Solute-binding protein family 3/N-terminal domain-containing protein n=1 Tax=Poseidonibacter parvus TaxID=1850254 RepID=A0A1P8KK43_9BACT|nr:hypothetical protein [Poseidonibacter parvus]APW64910.1 hypothetical protein LPB137_03145 [Poseidonibacter parvus]